MFNKCYKEINILLIQILKDNVSHCTTAFPGPLQWADWLLPIKLRREYSARGETTTGRVRPRGRTFREDYQTVN